MKSFYEHLRSRREFGEQIEDTRKPVMRSSAIFPAIQNSTYKTQILFMSYWLIKRDIPEISSVITLRDKSGKILKRNFMSISEPKSFSLNLDSMLKNHPNKNNFLGSLEVEFFSTRDMVYPFPAVVLNYYNNEFNTCVHTTGRIYNDIEDLSENEKFLVPETGFDIYSNDDLSSFLAFVNGPQINENGTIDYIITNHESKKLSGNFSIGNIHSFETIFLNFSDCIPKLNEFLNEKSGSISIKHNFTGFYPRFLVGTIQESFPSVSFTHSYYDCTLCNSPSDYWDRISDDYHDSSLYIPIFTKSNRFTELIIYPNLSPSTLNLQINLHDNEGNILQSFPNYLKIDSSKSQLMKINFDQLLNEVKLNSEKVTSAHIITNSENRKIPTRMKFGLNIGMKNQKSHIPCNICFNSKLGNPLIENKPGSFHWCPIFNNASAVVTIGNFSPKKNYSKSAQITLTFYHEEDSQSIEKIIKILPNAEYRFRLDENGDIKSFLHNANGWITMKSDNPFVQGYYFNFHSSGSVAGDHWF
jgi:hypothetical protein